MMATYNSELIKALDGIDSYFKDKYKISKNLKDLKEEIARLKELNREMVEVLKLAIPYLPVYGPTVNTFKRVLAKAEGEGE